MKSSKLTLWLLVASLAGNVFFGAVMSAPLFRPPPRPPQPERIVEEMAESLPAADARILREALDAKRGALAEEGDGPREFHERTRQVLLAEPFDPDSFRRLTSEFHARRERVGTIIGDILVEALPRMSPEGRKALADFRPPPPPRP